MRYFAGVVEGFYGQPWSHEQRIEAFDWIRAGGMNTFLYAPKDDLKHRAFWRECYDENESQAMAALAHEAKTRGVDFLYGLSPGLDIEFSSGIERQRLRDRLLQMIDLGASGFALLFDDLPGKLSEADTKKYGTVAEAQAAVVNEIRDWLQEQLPRSPLLFCPTPYCDRMVARELGGRDYLERLGAALDENVEVLWTGPEIVSEHIPRASLVDLADRIQRKPILWDNLHANDYDMRRLYCGPYNRKREILDCIHGVLMNPNCEFPINYVPVSTLADFFSNEDYDPRASFEHHVRRWGRDFTFFSAFGEESALREEDLVLLADCFYLPHELGIGAQRLLACIMKLMSKPAESWGEAWQLFHDQRSQVVRLFEQLNLLKNRSLFYAWSRRIWELREELDLVAELLEAKRNGRPLQQGFLSGTHLPGTYRGGLVATIQQHLTMRNGKIYIHEDSQISSR